MPCRAKKQGTIYGALPGAFRTQNQHAGDGTGWTMTDLQKMHFAPDGFRLLISYADVLYCELRQCGQRKRGQEVVILKPRYVGCGRAFLAVFHSKLNALTFVERTVVIALNGRKMDKHVLAAVFRRDETETFLCIKPLHRS